MSERFHYLENARHDQDTSSPATFMGGIAGTLGAGLSASANAGGNFDRAKYESMAQKGGIFGNLAQKVLAQNPMTAPVAPTAPTVDMSAGSTMDGGTMDQANPFEGKTFQITPANMMGNATPVFNEQTQGMAQTAFGSALERQMSMPNSGSVTQMKSPLEGNAFIGAKMAAEKAGESTFEVDGKTFNVK